MIALRLFWSLIIFFTGFKEETSKKTIVEEENRNNEKFTFPDIMCKKCPKFSGQGFIS